jgi:hypothetical protein
MPLCIPGQLLLSQSKPHAEVNKESFELAAVRSTAHSTR